MGFPIYGDENAQSSLLFELLTRAGVLCSTANAAGTNGLPDEAQLEYASEHGLVILTHDVGDFQRLHANWAVQGRHHAGILLVTDDHTPAPVLFRGIMRLQAERDAGQMVDAILFLGGGADDEQP